ncbi:MAG: ADP-ribose pyrophosphatase [Acidimicrobiales bacterium]|nr:ADP-ribose pyrophosphatase [Acidimicrobiales bacterium]
MTTLELLDPGDARLAPATGLDVATGLLVGAALDTAVPVGHRDEVLRLIDAHRDVAHRSCLPGHLTGSALVVDPEAARTLLMLHRKLGRWFQPGGHADGDTNLAAVALREAQEETGIDGLRVALPAIDVDVHEVAPPGEERHLHLDTRFLVVAPPGAREQANEESLALRWLTEAELDGLDPPVDESTRRLVHRGLQLARTAFA